MNNNNLTWKSATELRHLLDKREVSAVEILASIKQQFDLVNPDINAFAIELFDQANTAALESDKRLANGETGLLSGIPVSVKDSQWLAGVPCKNGSQTLTDFIPTRTCAAIDRLQDAGAVIFGKTTCPEFSYVGVTNSDVYGLTRNPWNLERTPGGSSGGAGAALAAGVGPLSLGGDGGGSIRIPAAFCGLVGFKPTFGAVPREPCFPTWKSLAVYGPMARSVEDAQLMFNAIVGHHTRDRHSIALPTLPPVKRLKGLKVVVTENLGHAPVEDDVVSVFHKTLQKLEAAGVDLIYDDPGLDTSVETWATTAIADAWVSDREDYKTRNDDLMEVTRNALDLGKSFDLIQFIEAQYDRERIHKAYVDLYQRTGASFLLKPTLGLEAFRHGRTWPERIGDTEIELPWVDWAGFLYDANLAGFPACALPIGFGDEGLPISLQIVGPNGSDHQLLQLAALVEEAVEWPGCYPDLAEYTLQPNLELRESA